MLSNHFFWLEVALLSWSGFSINTSVNFNGTNETLKNIFQWIGLGGMLAGIIRMVMLCLHFNWWWLLGIILGFFVVIGIISALIQGKIAIIMSSIGIVGIPIIWWIGGLF